MFAETLSALSLEYVRSASPAELLAKVQSWINASDSTCLVHPHGFFVVLLNQSEAEDWRFHWWPAGPKKSTGMPAPIHTHDKVVESRILKGELTNIRYDVTEVEFGGSPLYEVEYLGDKYKKTTGNILNKTASRYCAKISNKEVMGPGDCYVVDSNVYHEAVVPDGVVTATIVCMHSASAVPVKVLGIDGYPERIEFKRTERRAVECMNFG